VKRVLRLDCSPRGPAAHSWRMADELMERLAASHPGLQIVRRDIGRDPPPPIDLAFAAAMRENTTAEQARRVTALAASEALIGELEETDGLVVATPMHNYTVPVGLKAWIDQVVRFGRTFRSTPEGKVGLLADRPAFIVISAGGFFTPPRARQPDFLQPYLVSILATIGIRDVALLPLEGLNRGEAEAGEAYRAVRSRMDRLLPL
jgi:FMN-dependent NADH-azoreductase